MEEELKQLKRELRQALRSQWSEWLDEKMLLEERISVIETKLNIIDIRLDAMEEMYGNLTKKKISNNINNEDK